MNIRFTRQLRYSDNGGFSCWYDISLIVNGYWQKHTWDGNKVCMCVGGPAAGNSVIKRKERNLNSRMTKASTRKFRSPSRSWVKIWFPGFPANLQFMLMSEFRSRVVCHKVQCQHLAIVKSFLPASLSLICRNRSRFCETLSIKNLKSLI